MTNQDHNTPAEPDERVAAETRGFAAGGNDSPDRPGGSGAQAPGGEPQRAGVHQYPADDSDDTSGGDAGERRARPGERASYDYGPPYTEPAPYSGPGSSPAASGSHGDAASAHGGAHRSHGGARGSHGWAPDAYGEAGRSRREPGEVYPSLELQAGWEYADHEDYPAAAPFDAAFYDPAGYDAAYPESPPATGSPQQARRSGLPPSHQGQPAQYDQHGADYGNVPAEALAPLPPRRAEQQRRETSDSLTPESLLPTKKPPPAPGWRRAVYRATGGLIRPGESHAELRRRELVLRARTPVAGGHHRVAVMSLKGGVGKTTTVVGLGAMLASLRGDRVIAVDANPDRGTLSDKVHLETSATVRDLLNERTQIQRYADVRAFTSQAPSRLEVLASDRDPAVSVAFSEKDYYDVAHVLEHYYSVCITDCGTGLLHSAMAGVLQLADQIVLVSSPSVDGARSASATLDWLDAHDYGDLVRNAVVVLSIIRPRSKSTVDLDRLEQHFAGRCRAVARIPFDAHLEEGAEVDLEFLNPETADAYLMLAATVGDGFAWPRRLRIAAS